jgi:hypothetical protein
MSDPLSPALRDAIRLRAGRACEYCRLHEEDCRLSHEPDHVIARKHRGETALDNLAGLVLPAIGTRESILLRLIGKLGELFACSIRVGMIGKSTSLCGLARSFLVRLKVESASSFSTSTIQCACGFDSI